MSNVKRYDLFVQTGVELEDAFLSDCENGDWVKFADYERLREALEKLQEGLLFGATNEERLQIVREALCPTPAAISSSANSVEKGMNGQE